MYSSADLERFYFQYQTEGLPNGYRYKISVTRIRYLTILSTNGTRIYASCFGKDGWTLFFGSVGDEVFINGSDGATCKELSPYHGGASSKQWSSYF